MSPRVTPGPGLSQGQGPGLELQIGKALSHGTMFLGFLVVHAGEMFPDTADSSHPGVSF